MLLGSIRMATTLLSYTQLRTEQTVARRSRLSRTASVRAKDVTKEVRSDFVCFFCICDRQGGWR